MAVVTVDGERYEMTEEQERQFQEYRAVFGDRRALDFTLGGYEDLIVEETDG